MAYLLLGAEMLGGWVSKAVETVRDSDSVAKLSMGLLGTEAGATARALTGSAPDANVGGGVYVTATITGRALAVASIGYAAFATLRWLRRRQRAVDIPDALVVVTGASSGIGAATAERLAQKGARVVLVARNAAKLKEVADRITSSVAGASIHVVPLDCSDGAAVTTACEAIDARLGTPDIVVNSAGAGEWRYLHEMDESGIRACLDAPFLAAAFMCREFVPRMVARGSGSIVNIQSPAAYSAFGGATAYICGRYALRGLSEAVRADCSYTGVQVQEVVLGETDSAYFHTNAGSRDRLPWISTMLVGTISPHAAAQYVVDGIESGKRLYVAPWSLSALMRLSVWMPRVVTEMATLSGWRSLAGATPPKAATDDAPT